MKTKDLGPHKEVPDDVFERLSRELTEDTPPRERDAAFDEKDEGAFRYWADCNSEPSSQLDPFESFTEGRRYEHAHARHTIEGLERELNEYKIVNKYHAEKLGQLDELIEKAEAAIITFQWVTNSFKMSPEQQVRLGDAIVDLHDACEAAKDKERQGGGQNG